MRFLKFYKIEKRLRELADKAYKSGKNPFFKFIHSRYLKEAVDISLDIFEYPEIITGNLYDNYISNIIPISSNLFQNSKNIDNKIEVYGFGANSFDYNQFDYNRFAVTKYKTAGTGIASLILETIWSTLFSVECQKWKKEKKTDISSFFSMVNDILENSKYKAPGRFLAAQLAILNSCSGKLQIANAGENSLLLYRAEKKIVEEIMLPEAPAIAVFPSIIVENSWAPDKIFKTKLETGDILLLMNDSLSDSFRQFREYDKDFHNDYSFENWKEYNENFSIQRMTEIINAVNTQSSYILKRKKSPDEYESFEFDFSNINPSVENIVLAVLAVERIFHLNPDPDNALKYAVKLNSDIAVFMEKTFPDYPEYFSHEIESYDNQNKWFTHVSFDTWMHGSPVMLAVRYRGKDNLYEKVAAAELTPDVNVDSYEIVPPVEIEEILEELEAVNDEEDLEELPVVE